MRITSTRGRELRRTLIAAAVAVIATTATACSSDSEAGTPAAQQAAKAAANAAAGQVQNATAAPAPAAPQAMFIANTAGTGVSLRTRCEDGARLGGTGLREGTEVTVVNAGADQCAGWTLVDAAGTTSWVRQDYLSPNRPAAVAAAAPQAPRSTGGSAPPQPPASTPRFEKVLVYGEHLIPLSQLEYRSASFGPIILTPTGPKPGSYVCPAYNYSAPAVRTVSGVVLQNPDPEGCGFGRSDTGVVREALIQ